MKVIKRDGKAVDYNREKIEIAIEKANNEVSLKNRVSKEQIKDITKYIEDIDRKRILVEDIQDIIEEQLMNLKKFELAKKYMIYRYRRALVRKQNTTDESILGLIKNKNRNLLDENYNKNPFLASVQRDYIAGEVSKDLSRRILLPEKIAKADAEGIICFHNMDYFLQPIFNSCLINMKDMLDNGTIINGKQIEEPKSFRVACIVLTQIIATIVANQYGESVIDISCLGEYLRKSSEKIKTEIEEEVGKELSIQKVQKIIDSRLKKEICSGIQTIIYQINTLITTKAKMPNVTIFLNLNENDKYIKENAIIIEEILSQTMRGIKDEEGKLITPKFPKLIYVLNEFNCLNGGKYDYLTKLAIKCSNKTLYPYYLSAKKMKENFTGNIFPPLESGNFLTVWKNEEANYKFDGRFNQGVVSINLPQIGIIADGDEQKFWQLLDERLELCNEALMCKHYALLGTLSNASQIHWMHGGISRLAGGEKIDNLLKNGYSTISLGYVGLYEVSKLVKGIESTQQEIHNFELKIIKHLKDTINRWKKETGLGFTLCTILDESIRNRFVKIDREKYGIIKGVTDKEYYTTLYNIDTANIDEKIKLEGEFQNLVPESAISHINIDIFKDKSQELERIIKSIYENLQYVEFI